MAIPKRIIQVSDQAANFSPLAKAAVATVRLHNPGFEYEFFDGRRMDDFMSSEFPQYRAVFDAFPHHIQRFDFFRYLAVYRLGGFYFDTDVVLSRGIHELTEFSCVFPFERLTWSDFLRNQHGMDWEIGNYAFGAAAGHPFLGAIIENCLRAQRDAAWVSQVLSPFPRIVRDEFRILYTTGPGLVSRTFAEGPTGADDVKFLVPEDVCRKNSWNLFGDFGIHLMQATWRNARAPWRRRLVNAFAARNERRAIQWTRRFAGQMKLDRNGSRRYCPL